jgi:Cd2+/Zn2+-exporting ATPase
MRDRVRTESRPVIERLKSFGMQTLMLTGDREAVAECDWPGSGTRIRMKSAPTSDPEDKVNIIREMTQIPEIVWLMVGDGVNDAPSLAAAYVSMGMGARGTDAALEQCEVVLMKDRIDNFLNAYELSRRGQSRLFARIWRSPWEPSIVMVTASILGWIPLECRCVGPRR